MRRTGDTAYLSWEDLTMGLAADRAVTLPEGVTKLKLDDPALEMAKFYFEGEEIE